MTRGELYGLTPREFFNAVQGFNEAEENRMKDEWERARLVAYYAVSPYLKDGKTMERVIPLPWDAERKARQILEKAKKNPLTEEQKEVLRTKLKKTL